MELMPGIHQIDGVTCNVYLIVEPDGLTLVDSGMPGAQKRILAAVQALGHAPRDVRRILLTHQHIDHVGGRPRWSRRPAPRCTLRSAIRPLSRANPRARSQAAWWACCSP